MTNLIPQNHSVRISSRDIAEATDKQHFHVIRDIKSLIEQKAITESNFGLSEYQDASGKRNPEYLLDYEATMVLVTGYDAKRRAAVIRRWVALEKGEATPAFQIPQNYHEAMFAVAEQAKARFELEKKNATLIESAKKAKPKIDFHDAMRSCPDTMEIGRFAKIMGTGRNRLFAWLRDKKYLMKNNVPYQPYIDAGLFRVVENLVTCGDEVRVKSITYITGKGQTVIQKRWAAEHGLHGLIKSRTQPPHLGPAFL